MENGITLQLNDYLKKQRKKTITLEELLSLFDGDAVYDEFADGVAQLIDLNVLLPIKSAGFSTRKPRLPYRYKINNNIWEEYKRDIERLAITLHPKINLEYYFSQPQSVWEEDREHILKLDRYLQSNGLPEYPANAPERSYQIFGDEKFIENKSGKRLLRRLRLYEELQISTSFDPAMFFINAKKLHNTHHKHLIIENRTPFYALSEIVHGSEFTSLIYGAGFNILASIAIFEKQIDLPGAAHQYFYFGDLDYSGVSIWHYVSEKVQAVPALPFYRALLARDAAYGKDYQPVNMLALQHFLGYFDRIEQERIQTVLERGQYYPQEALVQQELHNIFYSFFEEGIYGN